MGVSGGSTRGSPAPSAPSSPGKNRVVSKSPYYFKDEEELTDVDEDDMDELGSVESEKSVILHLIGQLKIGMDLTKVTLGKYAQNLLVKQQIFQVKSVFKNFLRYYFLSN